MSNIESYLRSQYTHNTSFTVDDLCNQLLLEDARVKQIVKKILGKDYIFWKNFKMDFDDFVKVIETTLTG